MLRKLTRIPLLAFAASSALAQVYTWTPFAAVGAPSPRYDFSMSYDSVRQRAVMYGGMNAAGTAFFADTWEWDGTSWLARFSTHYPAPRSQAAMAYDTMRQRVVLFGGYGAAGPLDETWEWDGTDWGQRLPATNPPPIADGAMVYDAARQRVVLFGGVSPGGTAGMTWEWDGSTWTRLFPALSPLARGRHAMAYDELRQRIVLFAGITSNGSENDTWEWNGADWSQHALGGSLPFNRNSHRLVYDDYRQRVMLFGGFSSSGNLADTWEWDGVQWSQVLPLQSPPGRSGHGMVYDAARQQTVLFAGHSSTGTFNDTWWRGSVGTPATAVTYGVGCGADFLPTPSQRPIIGSNGGAEIHNCPTQVGGVAIGWSNQTYGPFALPVTLGGIGMTGCTLLQSTDVFGLPVAHQGSFSLVFSLPIPDETALIGQHAYLQAYVFAPGANPLGIVATQGIDWMFGDT